jgi:cell division protein YceG involved in septum cleavage
MTFLIVSLVLVVAISVYLTLFNKEKSEPAQEPVEVTVNVKVAEEKQAVEEKKEKKVLVVKEKVLQPTPKQKAQPAPKKDAKKQEKVVNSKKAKSAKSSNKK